jgi:hypothetical protein
MTSWKAETKKALTLWKRIPTEKQQFLLDHCTDGFVIELEVKPAENKLVGKVVNILFGMELDSDTKLYLSPDEIKQAA